MGFNKDGIYDILDKAVRALSSSVDIAVRSTSLEEGGRVNLGKSIRLATLEFFESVLDASNVSYILIHRTPDYIEIDSDNDGCDDILEGGSSDETDYAY